MKLHFDLEKNALKILEEATVNSYLQASAQNSDNYNRVWARDCAVTGIAILSNDLQDLYIVDTIYKYPLFDKNLN